MSERFTEVPYEKIEPDTLRRMIEEFIEREGTFYGETELPMEQQVNLVIGQLRSGEAVITWDLELESSNILLKNT